MLESLSTTLLGGTVEFPKWSALLLSVCATLVHAAQPDAHHLGVSGCASGNCHGAVTPFPGAAIAQDEYLGPRTRTILTELS